MQANIFLSMDGFLSLKSKVKSVLVIHDLAFEHFPQHLDLVSRWYVQKYSPRYAAKADRIATVSQFSKQDIINRYGIPEGKIDVVYNGSQEVYQVHYNGELNSIRDKFGLANSYFIYAGAIHPRKNVGNLFKAFDAFKRRTHADTQLVLAGRKAWKYKETLDVYNQMQFKDEVIFLGHIDAKELAVVMGGALSLVYVSKFEGFGLPLVEAMNCNIPVITSNTSSMPEVAGDAALLVDPDSVSEISASLERVYSDENLRHDLVKKGTVQREKFSWDKTAALLWDAIMKTCDGDH